MTAICRTVMRLLIFSMLLGVATLCRADLMIGAQAASQPLVLLRPRRRPDGAPRSGGTRALLCRDHRRRPP
jgi:hypothetical protein